MLGGLRMSRVAICVLGSFGAHDGAGNPIKLPTRKAEALLAVLALSPGGRQPRDRLLDTFWGSRDDAQARHSLSQTLTALRRQIGKDAFSSDRDAITLVSERLDIDIVRFLDAAGSDAIDDLQRAAMHYRGPLLDGLMLRESAFQEWIATERQRCAAAGVDVFTRLGRTLANHGNDSDAIRALETALAIDPLADGAHAARMQLHLDRGHHSIVARLYADCVRLYRRELDTGPAPEIERIARQAAAQNSPNIELIRVGLRRPSRSDHEPTRTASERLPAESSVSPVREHTYQRRHPVLVVLPFRNLSPHRDRNLVDGVVDDITLALSRLKEFRLIDRHSSVAHRGRALEAPRGGIDFGATYLVGGSVVRYSRAKARILVRLTNAETRTLLWCDRFDVSVVGPFIVQETFANQLAGAIHNAVRNAEIALVRCKPPASHDAYDLLLRAFPLMWSQDRLKNRQAIRLLRNSIALDGEYGRSHALLAWCLTQEIVYFWSDNPSRDRDSAFRAIETASHLIDDDPTAMAAIGAALSQCGEQDGATAWLKRALALDPNNAWAWGRYGHVALYSDDPESGKQRFERSLALSPHDPFAFNMKMGIAQALGMEGAYHEAIAITRDVLKTYPSVTWVNRTLASYHALTGDVASGQAALRRLIVATPNMSVRAMKHTHPMRHIPRYYDTLVEGLERSGLPQTK